MKHHLKRTACGLAAMAVGWWTTGALQQISMTRGGTVAVQPRAPRLSGTDSPTSSPTRNSPISWSPSSVPLEELAGIQSLRHSPAIKLESFIGQSHLFLGSPPTAPLATWLDLTSAEIDALNAILSRAAEARIAWETENLRSERVEAGRYRINWREPGNELNSAFQRELAETFGDTLARSIWIRGSLDRFAEPVPRWESRGVEEIEISVTPRPGGHLILRLSNGDWNNVSPVNLAADEIPTPPRLRHLFQLKTDSDELRELAAAAKSQSHPIATRASDGMVFSPFNGKVVDVRGIPPGTLVADPTLPLEEKAYFRTPPEE